MSDRGAVRRSPEAPPRGPWGSRPQEALGVVSVFEPRKSHMPVAQACGSDHYLSHSQSQELP